MVLEHTLQAGIHLFFLHKLATLRCHDSFFNVGKKSCFLLGREVYFHWLQDTKPSPLLPHQMPRVLFVFKTRIIQQIRVGHQIQLQLDSPGLGVRLGIVDGDVGFHASEVHAP
jgi:hypothetical protein